MRCKKDRTGVVTTNHFPGKKEGAPKSSGVRDRISLLGAADNEINNTIFPGPSVFLSAALADSLLPLSLEDQVLLTNKDFLFVVPALQSQKIKAHLSFGPKSKKIGLDQSYKATQSTSARMQRCVSKLKIALLFSNGPLFFETVVLLLCLAEM